MVLRRPACLGSALVCLVSLTGLAAAFTPVFHPELHITPTRARIIVDGVLADGEWRDAVVADNFAEHSPGDQVEPPVQTRVLVTYDADNLYVAFICDDDPAGVRASFCKRDQIFSDDNVFVCLDPYGDGAVGYEIAANPHGIQGDLFFSANGGEDMSYDLIYHTAGRITDEGWLVEMAIPFRSLRFPDRPEHVWRVDFWRNRPREVRYQMSWAAYDRDESCWPCQWGTLHGLADLQPPRGLELLPAVVGQQAGERRPDGTFRDGDVLIRGSFSARYGLATNVTAEATVRPDFSQVESDAAQIDVNSKFALFYPEKRPFFMEGSDLFATWFNAVYTRSINDPRVAGKVTGRAGKTSFAVLSALDRATAIILPFEEHSRVVQNGESVSSIVRVKQELGDQAWVGVVATDRRYRGGGSGSLVGLDSRLRLNRNYTVELQYLRSITDEPDSPALSAGFADHRFDGGHHTEALDGESYGGYGLYASLERDGRNWSVDLDFWDRSPTFRAENGFETANDQRQGAANASYLFRCEESTWLEWVQPSVYAFRAWNHDGRKKEDAAQVIVEARLRRAQIGLHAYGQVASEVFQGTEYPDLWMLHNCFRTTPGERISFGGNVNHGDRVFYSGRTTGRQTDYGLWLDLRPWDRLLVETTYSHSHSRSLDGGETFFDGYVTRTRLSLQLTRELSARLILQYNDFNEVWEADPLVSYQLDPFSIFYAGSTRDYDLFSPNATDEATWQLARRQYFVKFQYLFRV
ncbi:MAG: DUF5916 domain-containing protein [Candidatus Krumholzibacteriia bacterium]